MFRYDPIVHEIRTLLRFRMYKIQNHLGGLFQSIYDRPNWSVRIIMIKNRIKNPQQSILGCIHVEWQIHWIPCTIRQILQNTHTEIWQRFRLFVFVVWFVLCWHKVSLSTLAIWVLHEQTNDFCFYFASNEVFRLNLDQGKFLTPLQTTAKENTCCQINPVHELFTCGSTSGHVECWDPRVPKHISLLNCKANIDEFDDVSITALKYRDGLNLAVGTSTGHVSFGYVNIGIQWELFLGQKK